MLALLCLGLALLRAGRTPRPTLRIVLAGLALGLAAAMKATAWPALAVAFALVAARDGKRAAAWLACAAIAVPIAVDGPVLIAQPAAVVSNTILFPLGLTKIKSPAASFLPGHLIAEAWGPGHLVAIALVLLAGLGVAASLVLPAAPGRARGGLAAGDGAGAHVRFRPGQPVRLRCLPARPGLLAAAGCPGRGQGPGRGDRGSPGDTTGRSTR